MSTPDQASDDEKDFTVIRPEEQRDPEEEADFDREFAKMMAESMDTRRADKRPIQEISLPSRRPQQESNAEGNGRLDDGTTTKFALLSKKGNKAQVCLFLLTYFHCADPTSRNGRTRH